MQYIKYTFGLGVALIVLLSLSPLPTQAVGRCRLGYHFIHTPKIATYAITTCTKLTWKTLLYGYVADTSEQTVLATVTAPKHKALVELDVITVDSDSLAHALSIYFGGSVPDTLTYDTDVKYFSGGDVAVNTVTDTSVLDTTVYSFDDTNNVLYILELSAKSSTSAFSRQAVKIGQSLTVSY